MSLPKATEEYLDGIKAAALRLTATWGEYAFTEAQAEEYRNCGIWDDYANDGYTPDDAVREDISYWE